MEYVKNCNMQRRQRNSVPEKRHQNCDPDETDAMMPLSQMKEGMTGKIAGIQNESCHHQGQQRDENHHHGAIRLKEMGFYEGQQITVAQNRGKGPLVIKLQDSRMVLGRGLAMKILIRNNHT